MGNPAGTVTVNPVTGVTTFTPITGFIGTVQIPYTIEDGMGGSDTATLTVRIFDGPPVAEDDTNQTSIDTDVSGNVLINDSDPNPNDSISVTGVNGSALLTGDVFAAGTSTVVGTVTVDAAGNYTFSPDVLFTGEAEFTYTCLLYTSPSPRDRTRSRMPSSA